MYDLIKSVVSTGNYELSDILKKIDVQWIQNNLSDDERAELIALSQEKAKVQNSVDVIAKLEEFDKRILALEKANAEADTDTEDNTGTESTPAVEYAEYVAGKWYYGGDTIGFDGKQYVCIAPAGVVCVWSPIEYPAYWQLVEEEAAE